MPLTKIRYDMLDTEVTTKITTSIGDAGVGSPFVFTPTENNTVETLTGYKLTTGGVTTTETIRETVINASKKLVITLASFSPTFTATTAPGAAPAWDVPVTGFTVGVTNPDDYGSKWIDAVVSIAAVSGSSVSAVLADYTAGTKSQTPASTVDWSQTFSTGGSSYIRSSSTNGTGGTATGTLGFTYNTSAGTPVNHTATKNFTVTWGTPVPSISLAGLTGKTFLETYTGSTFTPSITNISNVAANCEFTVSATNATAPGIVQGTANQAITFTTPLHKNNAATTPTKVSVSAKITRPVEVTGSSYDVTLDTVHSAEVNTPLNLFTYPTFWIWTKGKETVPTREDCIAGSAIDTSVATITDADQGKTFLQQVTNSQGDPRCFWFAVRAGASQPNVFQSGTGLGLLSPATYTTATVSLAPDGTLPAGYSAELYNLYGIVIGANAAPYISIS